MDSDDDYSYDDVDDDCSYDDVDDDAGDSCDDVNDGIGDSYDEGDDVDVNGDAAAVENNGDACGESDDEHVNDDDELEENDDDVDEELEENDGDFYGEGDHEVVHDKDYDDNALVYEDDGDGYDRENYQDYDDIDFVRDDGNVDTDESNYSNFDSGENSHQSDKVFIEFDGASKGNPGRAGAGALLKSADGTVITRVCEGLGRDTNNAAEYKALIRGMKTAREMGYDRIDVKGDSELVVKQVEGEWKTRNDKMARLCEEAREIKGQFKEVKISHVPRGHNADADSQANKGVNLPAGQIQREDNPYYRRGR